jgi:hypothetical protein
MRTAAPTWVGTRLSPELAADFKRAAHVHETTTSGLLRELVKVLVASTFPPDDGAPGGPGRVEDDRPAKEADRAPA